MTKVVESSEINYNDHSFAKLGFNDRFVARWSGVVKIERAGTYTFKTCSDDGSNLFVGTERVVNNDGLHGTVCKEGSINLGAGKHLITVNFFENGGGANCKVQWKGPDTGGAFVNTKVSTTSASRSENAQWKGEFFQWPSGISSIPSVASKAVTKVVESSEINYNDHSFAKLGFNDRFVARWSGVVKIERAGTYTFKTCSDDGSNLFVGTERVVNNDGLHGTVCKEGSINLGAGKHLITVNFFENGGGANCKVQWKGPDVGLAFVNIKLPHSASKFQAKALWKGEFFAWGYLLSPSLVSVDG